MNENIFIFEMLVEIIFKKKSKQTNTKSKIGRESKIMASALCSRN